MKLSEINRQDIDAAIPVAVNTTQTMESKDKATAGNVATAVVKKKKQGEWEMASKRRSSVKLRKDDASATDSSDDFTENDQQTPVAVAAAAGGKHRLKKAFKRKRDLINLQSNLSPKYIGSPTTLLDSGDDNTRTTRRRQQATPSDRESAAVSSGSANRDRENDDTAAASVVADSPKSFARSAALGNYLSPIDKLLMKNGANSPNSTGFEADAEDVGLVQGNRKQLKRKMKRGPKSKNKEPKDSKDQPEEMPVEQEEVITMATDPAKIEIKTELMDSPIGEEEIKPTEEVPITITTEPKNVSEDLESMKSPPDLMEPPVTSEQSIKSPSSISIDSAKGSSIVTDSGWPTYQVGDLYWGKLFTYCYWPCMICPDNLGQIVGNPSTHPQRKSTDSAVGQTVPIQVHVRFFADNGRHNWIKSENLLPFAGLKSFEELREETRIKHGPKSAKFRQMVPKQSKLLVWRQAIDEAHIVGQLPYADRLEKFFEIYENTTILNKEKRKHSKIVVQETSDVGSSLYDSTDNLHARSQVGQLVEALKRERSSSPYSPAYSPVKHNHDKRSKRRKLSGSTEEHVGQSITEEEKPQTMHSPDLVNYKNPEFGQLFDAIKEYVMVHRQEDKVEKVLLAVVRNIWSLKQLQLRELQRDFNNSEGEFLGSARLGAEQRGRGVGTIKRLSNRLKTMVLRRSITPVVTPQPVTTAVAETERRVSEQAKQRQPIGRPIEEVVNDILQLDRKYLFRGLIREPVCKYCYRPGGIMNRCAAPACSSWWHADCLQPQEQPKIVEITQHITGDEVVKEEESDSTQNPVLCQECASGKLQTCCICRQENEAASTGEGTAAGTSVAKSLQLIACNQPLCHNKFHVSCCKYWPQASFSNSSSSSSRCPMHVCHTCVSDDPSGKYQQLGSSKLIKCVKCPASYHQDSRCIPAGSILLTTTHLICPRHNVSKADANLNVLWCYICVKGGELLCCETCPIAVHAHCRNIPIQNNESYICEECESGRLPLYGEIVWAKFNNFRWWPAIILPPTEIPNNILKKPHGLNDFVVRFFGTNDHGWISRRRVYLYIEGDTGDGYKTKTLMSKRYTAGVEEATRFLRIIKEKRQEQAIARFSGNKLQPPPYIKIKANKPVPPVRFVYNEDDVSVCNCKPGTMHPCGPESGCLNRILYNECNPAYCHAGAQCENQLFELRKSPRLDVVYMNERGFGLVCRQPIREGDFIIEYVGEVINHAEFQRRMANKTQDRDENFYFLGVEKDFIIDAGPKGNLARFMNHSCEPNCATQKWTVNCINRVGIFAIKDIPENTELTFNYLWDDLMNNGKKACFCGAKRCSGEIGGKLKDEEIKETGAQSSVKGKTNSKLKQFQRSKGGIRIHVGAAKKRSIKKSSKSDSSNSTENVQTEGAVLKEKE